MQYKSPRDFIYETEAILVILYTKTAQKGFSIPTHIYKSGFDVDGEKTAQHFKSIQLI